MITDFLLHPLVFSPDELCRAVFHIHQQSLSGCLRIQIESNTHSMYWINGRIVAYKSSFPAFEWRQLLRSQTGSLIPKEVFSPKQAVQEGLITQNQWENHSQHCLKQALILPFRWNGGEIAFEPHTVDARTIDPDLFPKLPVLPTLWFGVREHLPKSKLYNIPSKQTIKPTADLARWFYVFDFSSDWFQVPKLLSSGQSMSDLSSILDNSKSIPSLLWILESCGLIEAFSRTSGQNYSDLAEIVDIQPLLQSTKTRHPTEQKVNTEYQSRMGLDYYAFLGVLPSVDENTIRQRMSQCLQRWSSMSAKFTSEDEALTKINILALNLYDVWAVLISPTDRRSYDEKRSNGVAPIANRVQINEPPLETQSAKINQLILSGSFLEAKECLEQHVYLQFQQPDLLANLGWANWSLGFYELGLVMLESALILDYNTSTLKVVDMLLNSATLPPDYKKSLVLLRRRFEDLCDDEVIIDGEDFRISSDDIKVGRPL